MLNKYNELQEQRKILLNFYNKISSSLQKEKQNIIKLEKYILELKDLVLIFTTGNGGGKFSLREDGYYAITIYNNLYFSKKTIHELFAYYRSSFIHELTHYLDIRGKKVKLLTNDYYNNKYEINAFLQQSLHNFEWDLEHITFNEKNKIINEMTKSMDLFLNLFFKKYFTYQFIKNINKENKLYIENILYYKFNELLEEKNTF